MREHVARVNPHGGVIQELIAASRLARSCIPDGTIRTGILGERDGAEVKLRLRDAVQAAREALAADGRYVPHVQLAESVHPGEILREELKARGLTQQVFADSVGRPLRIINQIIKGRKRITPDTALDLERGLGVSADFWSRLQADHDLHVARQRRATGGRA